VDADVFLCEVVFPVGVEVAVAADGSELEDGLGAGEAPACAGDVEAVFDEVAAGAFDDAGGDRPAVGQGGGVVEVGGFLGQVGRAGVGAGASGGFEPGVGGLAADRTGYFGGFTGQDVPGLALYPRLDGGIAFGGRSTRLPCRGTPARE